MTSANNSISHRGEVSLLPAASAVQGDIDVLDIMKIIQNGISLVTTIAKSSCVIQINLL